MNELISKSEKLISTRELAEQLGTSPKVVLENAKKCLPNKRIENGKATCHICGQKYNMKADLKVEEIE